MRATAGSAAAPAARCKNCRRGSFIAILPSCDPLLDHLVGQKQERIRERQSDSLDGFKIDDQLVTRGQLNWQIAWPFAFENPAHQSRGLPIHIREVRSIG